MTVFLPIFPDDLISIAMGSLKMNFKFYTIVNALGKLVGSFCLLLFLRLPIIKDIFTIGQGNESSILSIIIYIVLIILSIILILISKQRIKKINLQKSCMDDCNNKDNIN